jgi:hypothetical protein
MRMIAEYPLGRMAALSVRRGGAELNMTVAINEFPPAQLAAEFPFDLANPPSMAPGDAGLRLIRSRQPRVRGSGLRRMQRV